MIAIYPKIIHLAKAGSIESLACAVREYYGEKQAFAKNLDVWRLCQSIGVGLRERDSQPGGLARILARDERGQFEIVIERDAGLCRTLTDQLLIAHLLGHGFLDILPKIAEGEIRSPAVFSEGVVPILSSYQAEGLWKTERSLERERRADHFALALLLPKRFILAAQEKFRQTEKVARFFGLPEAVIKGRLATLGLGTPSPADRIAPSAQAPAEIRTTELPQSVSPSPAHVPAAAARASALGAYRAAPDEPRVVKTAPSRQKSRPAPLQGISQLRELAKKIDGSVDL